MLLTHTFPWRVISCACLIPDCELNSWQVLRSSYFCRQFEQDPLPQVFLEVATLSISSTRAERVKRTDVVLSLISPLISYPYRQAFVYIHEDLESIFAGAHNRDKHCSHVTSKSLNSKRHFARCTIDNQIQRCTPKHFSKTQKRTTTPININHYTDPQQTPPPL
jgi:hypothetical protein